MELEQKNISSILSFPSQNKNFFSTSVRYYDFLNSVQLIFQSEGLRSLISPQDFKSFFNFFINNSDEFISSLFITALTSLTPQQCFESLDNDKTIEKFKKLIFSKSEKVQHLCLDFFINSNENIQSQFAQIIIQNLFPNS
jgi:hypothetical protein